MTSSLLEVDRLQVEFPNGRGRSLPAVCGMSFSLGAGECLAIVGESGSGKTMTARSVIKLLPPPGRIVGGSIRFQGLELTSLSEREVRRFRGAKIGMIFQDPMSSLSPLRSIGQQIDESLLLHGKARTRREARRKTIGLLEEVGLPQPDKQVGRYRNQLSGGMNQRAMIAMVLASEPEILIADEPTTALDVTSQAGVLQLLDRVRRERDMAMLLITHDLAVVAGLAERVAIMYAGHLVEDGPVRQIFQNPRHPYTRALLEAIPGSRGNLPVPSIPGSIPAGGQRPSGCVFHPRCFLGTERKLCLREAPATTVVGLVDGSAGAAVAHRVSCHYSADMDKIEGLVYPESLVQGQPAPDIPEHEDALLAVRSLRKVYRQGKGIVRRAAHDVVAVEEVSFDLHEGETVGLVGESGSGKSTTARLILGLVRADSGQISFLGQCHDPRNRASMRKMRRHMQMIFQDPDGSLDPRMTVGDIVSEPLRAQKMGTRREQIRSAAALLERVGLQGDDIARYPGQFSGGQKQRIGIARALAIKPKLIVCDEPVTALDVSVQAEILNLIRQIQADTGVSFLFIAHDLAVVRQVAHRVVVMQSGRIVEQASTGKFFMEPKHEYSRALLRAMPVADPDAAGTWLSGEPSQDGDAEEVAAF